MLQWIQLWVYLYTIIHKIMLRWSISATAIWCTRIKPTILMEKEQKERKIPTGGHAPSSRQVYNIEWLWPVAIQINEIQKGRKKARRSRKKRKRRKSLAHQKDLLSWYPERNSSEEVWVLVLMLLLVRGNPSSDSHAFKQHLIISLLLLLWGFW